MCIYTYMRVLCIYIYMYVHVYMYMYICIYVCMYMFIYIYVGIYIYMYYMYINLYMYMYMYMYMYIYIYIYVDSHASCLLAICCSCPWSSTRKTANANVKAVVNLEASWTWPPVGLSAPTRVGWAGREAMLQARACSSLLSRTHMLHACLLFVAHAPEV